MAFEPSQLIYAKRITGKGLGVFARVPIAEGQEIERCPVIVMPLSEARALPADNVLGHYAFTWSDTHIAIALGYGSLYNHAQHPNAEYADRAPRTKVITALRDIAAGEEITIHYHGQPGSEAALDFEQR